MRTKIRVVYTILCIVLVIWSFGAKGDTYQQNSGIISWNIFPTSLVKQGRPSLQRIELSIVANSKIEHCTLQVLEGENLINEIEIGLLKADTNNMVIKLPEPKNTIHSTWKLLSGSQLIAEKELEWEPPRHWTLYVIKSSHVDIGLHDSQYKQRYFANSYIDEAVSFIDSTDNWPDASRYRYMVEGQWWWLNYPIDRSEKQANDIVRDYVKPGRLGIGASHSGNHTQAYGVEELCRSAYYAQGLRNRWGLKADAMLMVDNNGITWPLVNAYVDAGIKYLGFFPNDWNPETVGGARIDFAWDSTIPHLFYWEAPDKKAKILLWGSPHYRKSGNDFGFETSGNHKPIIEIDSIVPKMAKQLNKLESKYPYDIWLIPNYSDNETPNLNLSNFVENWNKKWCWPQLRTVGDISQPFCEVEERFKDKIPTLSGVITGGWAQHPVSTPTLLADKMEADRLLPIAEKMATLAFLMDSTYIYPELEFKKAWDALICNDEHGYGTSYYKGRPVYDTWMQKKDWIDKASTIAQEECDKAISSLAAQIKSDSPAIVVFNPTLQRRSETVEIELPELKSKTGSVEDEDGNRIMLVAEGNNVKFLAKDIPSLGYKIFKLKKGKPETGAANSSVEAPFLENDYYRIQFTKDGTISSIYDKELDKELIDSESKYKANQFVYTQDANNTFSSPGNAIFRISRNSLEQEIVIYLQDSVSGTSIEQEITLPEFEKRIDIDNKLDHVSDLARDDRWKRFGYYAFPFDVPNGEFRVGLNGCDANAFKDQTTHGTNIYHVARDWAYVGNGQYGIALLQQDNYLIEFGEIHKDKRALIEKPSKAHFYPYIFNDWLYAHAYVTGPSYINLRYRFSIYSHKGEFEDGKISQLAERKVNPLIAKTIKGEKHAKSVDLSKSFLSVNSDDISLLTLKLSDSPGKGIIARFHETGGKETNNVSVNINWDGAQKLTECSLTEQDEKTVKNDTINFTPFGYNTLRIESGKKTLSPPNVLVSKTTDKSVTLKWSSVDKAKGYRIFRAAYSGFDPDQYHLIGQAIDPGYTDDWLDAGETNYYIVSAYGESNQSGSFSKELTASTNTTRHSPPSKVGIYDTGLISNPRAWRGDSDTILYLEWGQNRETNIAYYELFRSKRKDFELTDETLVTKVEPGKYATVPCKDTGLKPHTTYYYRVRAVDKNGNRGDESELFQGTTREINDCRETLK